MKMNTQQSKPMGHREGSPDREVHNDTGQPQKDRNISNKQPNPASPRSEITTTNKAQSR